MKKLFPIIFLVVLLAFLLGCSNNKPIGTKDADQNPVADHKPSDSPKDTSTEKTVKDYFSYEADTRYIYEGMGNEYASYDVYVDYLTDDRVQLRSNNGGTETVKVLENKNGELTMLRLRGECYWRENLTQGPAENPEILIKEPLAKGTEWILSDGRKRYISDLDVEVITPAGKYQALEVTTEGKEDKIADYYAPGIGLVKSVFTSNGMEVSSTLAKIEKDTPLVQTVKFFYPNANADKIYYVDRQLSFHTNDITKLKFEQVFKDLPKENLGKVLGNSVKIKSLYLNKDNRVYVDFSKELISEMNAGSGYESMILQSITNTLGGYYGTDKVHITVEGAPYASGHFEMKKSDFFKVDLDNCFELK